MRIIKHYYSLVAGLPELILEQNKLQFSPGEFKEYLHEEIDGKDLELVKVLYLPHDNFNLLNLLQKSEEPFNDMGNYSHDLLEEEKKEPSQLPQYMQKFIINYLNETTLDENMSWENQLTGLFYDYITSLKNDFLDKWFEFERNVKNVMAGLMARKYDHPLEGELIGHEAITESIRKSHARDFGLANDFPEVEKLLHIFDKENLLEREKDIDQLKWQYIDELNTFNYFTIEVILGYVIKLNMVNRWMQLDEETGREMFNKLLEELRNSFEFQKEFDINGRKR
ncbi:MAG: DUF2764 domain-containing protein [Bacteroidales bacterium]|nr:DUF2764 domain-containing protein [Bacteroidales bacterium]